METFDVLNQSSCLSHVPSSTESLSVTPHLANEDVSLNLTGTLFDPDIENHPPFCSIDSFLEDLGLMPSPDTSEIKAPPPPPDNDDNANTPVPKTDDPSSQPESIVNHPESPHHVDNSPIPTNTYPQDHQTPHQQSFEIVHPVNGQTTRFPNKTRLTSKKLPLQSTRRTRSSQAAAPTNLASQSGVKTRSSLISKKRKRDA